MTVTEAKQQLLGAASNVVHAAPRLTVDFIRRHPLETTLAAGVLGVVLGVSPNARRSVLSLVPAALMKFL